MKVILLKDIARLGTKYDIKEVNSGHALNYLIPQKLAIPATAEAIRRNEAMKKQIEQEKGIRHDLLLKNINDLDNVTIVMKEKANEKGHLFAGIHKEVIVSELLKQTGLQIDPSSIELDQHIKNVGEHKIKVNGAGKTVIFNLIVEATTK